ncbi:MAG: hypothetical protein ACJ72C_01590 [Nitrososphaeraceae archaeon]
MRGQLFHWNSGYSNNNNNERRSVRSNNTKEKKRKKIISSKITKFANSFTVPDDMNNS